MRLHRFEILIRYFLLLESPQFTSPGPQNAVGSFFSNAGTSIKDFFSAASFQVRNFITERQSTNPALTSASLGFGIAALTGILSVIGKIYFLYNFKISWKRKEWSQRSIEISFSQIFFCPLSIFYTRHSISHSIPPYCDFSFGNRKCNNTSSGTRTRSHNYRWFILSLNRKMVWHQKQSYI